MENKHNVLYLSGIFVLNKHFWCIHFVEHFVALVIVLLLIDKCICFSGYNKIQRNKSYTVGVRDEKIII
jgi:hypothetical protein